MELRTAEGSARGAAGPPAATGRASAAAREVGGCSRGGWESARVEPSAVTFEMESHSMLCCSLSPAGSWCS